MTHESLQKVVLFHFVAPYMFVLRGKKEPEIGGLGEHMETCSKLIQVFSHHHHRFGLDQSGGQVDQHWHPQLEIEVTNEQIPRHQNLTYDKMNELETTRNH